MAYKKKTAGKKPYKKRVYKRRPVKKTSLVKTIKRVIHSQIENKILTTYQSNIALNYAGTLTNPSYVNLTPSPSLGTGVAGRIGNQIRMVKCNIRGFVNLLPYNVSTNPYTGPIYVKMWLCRRKLVNINSGGVPGTNDFSQFFDTGSSSVGFQSNMLDMVFKPNNMYWTCLSQRKIQLSNTYQQVPELTPGNSNVSVPFNYSFAKHLGLLKYNDSNVFPSNKELFLVFQTVWANGTTLMATQNMAEIHYQVSWEYEDA